ncbi:energy-coupled thiamine transporter ThiT [Fonticella tunisiensis]|uniref:Thiamine transporter n=1 Tax=Fonticella tunisiensis TaxID=1096341 RepID=A0A4R7K9G5_9CLOT|nr:energy-coupled thiamine transporter ThiT [Fonticella tunisiensis]TDT50720.1 thiamine transporter [Fonticella tunisiensis]
MYYFINMFKKIPEIKLQSWAFMLGLIAASLLISRILERDEKFNTKKLTYGSLCVALAFILSYIRLYKMPQGGSVTLGSMLPIMFYAFIFGPMEGILAGMVYGILQFIQDPYIVHWFQVLIDYPFAFGALGLAGYFKNNFPIGVTVGVLGRFIFNFLSGVFFFADYAPEGMSPVLYSIIYNGSFLSVELIIALIIVMIPQFKQAILRVKSEAL